LRQWHFQREGGNAHFAERMAGRVATGHHRAGKAGARNEFGLDMAERPAKPMRAPLNESSSPPRSADGPIAV